MASIRKRGNLQWEARIRRKGMPVTCKTFETRYDAEKWAREIEAEMDKGAFVSRTEAESTTLAEALERYITEYIPRLAHADKSERMARALQKRGLASLIMARIRGKDIADFIKEREAEGVSANTVRLDLAIISRLFNVAIANWGMETLINPVGRVAKPRPAPGRERRLEEGEEERLLAASGPELHGLIRLALAASGTKNKTVRTIPLSPRAIEIFREIQRAMGRETAPADRLFDLHPDAVTKAMARACQRAGLPDLHFHDLRHEATSRLFENTDLDVMEIRAITGHKTM